MLTQPPQVYTGQRVLHGSHLQRGYVQPGYAYGAVTPDNRIILQDPDPSIQELISSFLDSMNIGGPPEGSADA